MVRTGVCAVGPGPQTRVGQRLRQRGASAIVRFMRVFRLSPECHNSGSSVAGVTKSCRSSVTGCRSSTIQRNIELYSGRKGWLRLELTA